jgi:hypothetical protein
MSKQDQNHDGKCRPRCATMHVHRRMAAVDPEYRRNRRELELETRQFIARYAGHNLRTGIVRIPVVVHVVWNTTTQNISDAQITSQLDVLNADFRRTNSDAASVPAVFAGVAADFRIEFALAVRDPNCNATTGITRTKTAITGFTAITASDERMKSTVNGGHDPWDVTKYLNIWIVNYTDGTLGYGTFPNMPANIQGLVCDYRAFGTVGAAVANAPYNLGRTASHEVGHWLNLLHIWGDDDKSPSGICSGSDECGDTPNQGIENYGTPAFPHVSCGNGPNGDMFMNYMDYVDDAAMFMFTQDQATRANATLALARAGILASDGLVPVGGGAPAPDLWMQDNADDTGTEPDPSANPMYISDDIWVRNSPDGFTNQDHQNPNGEQMNYVYVRVRNRGCSGGAAQSGTLKLYWAKASTALSWPSPWDASITSPALMGGMIGSQSVTVNGGATQIVEFHWTPPDPSDYASFGADQAHFCLLARIETSAAAPFGMTSPETANLYSNVRNNNNIVWKNISIVDTDGAGARFAAVVIGNLIPDRKRMHFIIETLGRRRQSLFDWGHVLAEFRGEALIAWAKKGLEGKGFVRLPDGRLFIAQSGAELIGPPLKVGAFGTLRLQFVPDGRQVVGARVFELDVVDLDGKGQRLGGQRFLLKTTLGRERTCWDTQLGTFDGVTWMPKSQGCCGWKKR